MNNATKEVCLRLCRIVDVFPGLILALKGPGHPGEGVQAGEEGGEEGRDPRRGLRGSLLHWEGSFLPTFLKLYFLMFQPFLI